MPRVLPSHVVEFIESSFPAIRNTDNLAIYTGPSGELAAIVTLVDSIPPELITVEGHEYSGFVFALDTIKSALTRFHQRSMSDELPRLAGKSPVAIIRSVLAKCHDQAVQSATAALTFIKDADLRESIRLDLSSSNRDLINGEHKGATVLAGAAVEALLLWAVQEAERLQTGAIGTAVLQLSYGVPQDPEYWNLTQLIDVALLLGLIESTPTAISTRLCKDFRNLIHPGRAQRTGTKCNRGTAMGALSAAEHVVSDLSRKFP